MDAVEFLKQFNRMCKAYNDDGCKECPAYKYRCGEEFDGQEEDGVHIVEQWAKEHPVKTRQSEFLKQLPNARRANGILVVCPMDIMGREYVSKNIPGCINSGISCDRCRHDFWLKEIE